MARAKAVATQQRGCVRGAESLAWGRREVERRTRKHDGCSYVQGSALTGIRDMREKEGESLGKRRLWRRYQGKKEDYAKHR